MPEIYDHLELIKDELAKCMKCGNCMAVCPIYSTEKTESGVARGKISLVEAILNDVLTLDDENVGHKLFNCLVCKSCMQNCYTRVNFDKIILAVRAAIARKKGLHPIKRVIFELMKKQVLFDTGMRIGGRFQGLLFKRHPSKKALYPRFAMGLSMKRIIPPIQTVPFRSQAKTMAKPDKPKLKVAFFTGCSINYMFPHIGNDVLEVLRENNVEVVIPKDQQCCGIAVFAHGDIESARELARKNLDAFANCGAEYIVTACGSCGGSWQHEFKELLAEDPEYLEKALYWSTRTFDISVLLTKIINYRLPQGTIEATVTYHDPCHLKKSMNVYQEPRTILQSIPGVTLTEMAKPDACCGSGGSFSLTHYDTSIKIVERKIADINTTVASLVITGCPGCMIHITDGINQFGQGQDVNHYISLLAEAYRQEKKILADASGQ